MTRKEEADINMWRSQGITDEELEKIRKESHNKEIKSVFKNIEDTKPIYESIIVNRNQGELAKKCVDTIEANSSMNAK